MNRNIHTGQEAAVSELEAGASGFIDELRHLVDQGDVRAMRKLDEWEMFHSNAYAGNLIDACPDEDCAEYGEPVNICYAEDGSVLDIDHGSWGHYPAARIAKAS